MAAATCSVAVLLGGCGTAPAHLIKAPLKDLVLTLSEIPYPGFVVEHGSSSAGYYSNQRTAGKNGGLLRKLQSAGREEGYEADFNRSQSPQQAVGPVVIESSASIYRSATGAGQGLRLVGAQALAAGGTAVSTGKVGDQALGFMEVRQFEGTSYEAYIVAWRQANVVAAIQVEGNAATLDIQYAISLATIQQRQLVSH
ncbi:MAG: hypothetical protein HKL89_04655 [Candidatus Dormibacteraeota bacterium]|nr:hypothetical protein [Candidatus Dormibacteraeota bacterium]